MAYKNDPVTDDDIGSVVRQMEDNFVNGVTNVSKYVQSSMYEDLNKIDAYINSRHISGETDSQGRQKPFFNIVTAARNIWYRATDIDRKHIRVRPTKLQDTTNAFLATVLIQDWMRRTNFGQFLNEWGRILATYGSAVCKFVEKEGELKASVIPWQRLIVDSIDFEHNPKIEVLELTEAQLYNNPKYNQEMVEKLCDAKATRELIDGTKVDNRSEYIKLYEVHGYLPKSYLTGKPNDEDEYVQQMHVISFIASKEENKFDDFTLYSGVEAKDPYMLTHLIKEEGQTLSIGAVKQLFDAQWMLNHTAKQIKDKLDLASKLIFQTSDGNFVGKNALNSIQNGDILIHAPNQPLTQLNNGASDIAALQSYANQWKSLSNEMVGISESMLGNTAPSGTAWRQVEALLQQTQSLFELMTENKGLHIIDMFTEHIISSLKKKLNTSDEVTTILAENDISEIDSKLIRNGAIKNVNRLTIDRVINEQPVSREFQAEALASSQQAIQDGLKQLGNLRSFKPDEIDSKTWKELLKDLEWQIEVDVTGESRFSMDDLTTLSTIFQTISDPARRQVLDTPEGKMLFNKILTISGTVSPLELNRTAVPSPLQAQPQTPAPSFTPPTGTASSALPS